ncbi:MAG: HEAT repeat domain-containing protein [Coriobacteriia bacterium]|nr:HEAT repeat domain-containing protein [Coriobacteriia bacterium]
MRDMAREPEHAPEAVERFVKQLLVAHRACRLYPASSEIPMSSAGECLGILRGLLREQPELRFQVTKEGLLYNALPVLPGLKSFESFAREFYHRNIAEVRFHSGVTPREIVDFLRALQEAPDAITVAGGFEQRLWDLQVDGITARMVSTKIVDAELEDESQAPVPGEDWPPTRERIDELVDAAYGARPRDQRMLVRFVQNPKLVSRYLSELASEGRGGRPLVNLIAGKVVSLAHAAMAELSEDQPELFRSIAESLLSLDPDVRRNVLVERLLPESRLDEGAAAVIRQFELGELCKALVEGLGPDPVSRDGLARAIRNLAVISLSPRETVIEAMASAMRESGMDEDAVSGVLQGAAPTQIKVRSTDARGEGIESILRLVDLAPIAPEAMDSGVAGLRAEVADGVTDGDILVSIITLVTIERRAEMFASLMSVVEDGLGLLLEWGEYGDAVIAATALSALRTDDTLDPAQQDRARQALADMASPRYMRDVATAVRVHPAGTPEHDECRRLIAILGDVAIAPLLEVLADEPDMAARKALVDMISAMAPRHIADLGGRISDSRWYFVRNVVGILGSTRDPAALQHLNRTLRHSDARVRRETIRAVASIRDVLAEQMLAAALTDDDPQNVGLAARYLGNLGSKLAVPALGAVARGEGKGNRDPATRIEAIEALGRLATPEAEAAVLDVGHSRAILRSGRIREIQAAAEGALANIRRARREGGA